MLGFIETLTLHPDRLGPADADAVRAAGVSDEATWIASTIASSETPAARTRRSWTQSTSPPSST